MIKPCKKCGGTERYTNGRCKPCKRKNSAEWCLANQAKASAAAAVWKSANPDYQARYYANNAARLLTANTEYRTANPEKVRAARANWRAANPGKWRSYQHNYRARKLEVGGKLSPDIAERLFTLQRGKCACGCKQPLGANYHRDHRMPLALGGTNTDDNIQLLRGTCNLQKSAKHPVDFMQQRGFLL